MFEKASKRKLRIETPRGLLAVEDLWDLPLSARGNGLSLDCIAKDLNKRVKASDEESFVTKKSTVDDDLDCKFSIVKRIIEVKLSEAGNREKEATVAARRQQIREAIADKKEEGLRSKSVEELQDELAKLEG